MVRTRNPKLMLAGVLCLVLGAVGLLVGSRGAADRLPVAQASASQSQMADTGRVLVAVVVPAGLAPIGVLGVGTPVTFIGATGAQIKGVVASLPHFLNDEARYHFDVFVALEDAPLLAQWVADGSMVVVSP